jgi:hypothetical protein
MKLGLEILVTILFAIKLEKLEDWVEKGHLLEIHLLKKTARHKNLDCSTLFKQMTKIYASAQKSKKYAVHVLYSKCIF